MLCPLGHGRRLFYFQGQLIPCPECEGHGEIHCCDGLPEQSGENYESVSGKTVTSEPENDNLINTIDQKKLDKSVVENP